MAMEWGRPVLDVIGDRLTLTVVIFVAAIIFTWVLALPIGIYSAVKRYSIGDYIATFIGFIGLAIPGFMLALIVMYVGFKYFNANIGGLFSAEMADAPWSWAKFVDLLKHLPVVAIVLGIGGTAQMIRIMRSNLLDELRKPYVMTARARGLSEMRVIMKYPVRVALNPFVSTHRIPVPIRRIGQHHRLDGVEPANGGTTAAQGTDRTGYVPGRDDRLDAGRNDRHRHIHLGPAADVDRPAHPTGEAIMAETTASPPETAHPHAVRRICPPRRAEEQIAVATQWQLMWWRFRKHKLAMVGTIVLILFYLIAVLADFLAYSDPDASEAQRSLMVPQPIHWIDNGKFSPHVYAITGKRDPKTFKRVYAARPEQKDPGALFRQRVRVQIAGLHPHQYSPDRCGRRQGRRDALCLWHGHAGT